MIVEWTVAPTPGPGPASKKVSLRAAAQGGETMEGQRSGEHDDMRNGLQPYTIDRYWRLCNVTLQGLSGLSGI